MGSSPIHKRPKPRPVRVKRRKSATSTSPIPSASGVPGIYASASARPTATPQRPGSVALEGAWPRTSAARPGLAGEIQRGPSGAERGRRQGDQGACPGLKTPLPSTHSTASRRSRNRRRSPFFSVATMGLHPSSSTPRGCRHIPRPTPTRPGSAGRAGGAFSATSGFVHGETSAPSAHANAVARWTIPSSRCSSTRTASQSPAEWRTSAPLTWRKCACVLDELHPRSRSCCW